MLTTASECALQHNRARTYIVVINSLAAVATGGRGDAMPLGPTA